MDNCWRGILGRVKGWTFPCRSTPMTQPNRLWQSRARTFRRWQSEFSAPMMFLIVRWQLMVFHRIEAKRSFSCTWWETGSLADRRLVRDGQVSRCQAKSSQVARHLGSHLGEKASFTHELPRRRQATMTAFYSVGQLWYESRVSWRLKTLLLHQSCGQHGTFWNRGVLSVERTVPSSHVSGDLSCEEGNGWRSSTEGGTWASPHINKQGGSAFLEAGTV